MSSSPLFISVAESTVTFGPIDHRGWLRACSTVTWSRSRAGWAQNGPPLAVMISRRTLSRSSPQRHCQIALCSLSIGRMPIFSGSAPCARPALAAFMMRAPAITSTSFVASATSLPAFSAAIVGASARAPGMATTTRSHRGSVTIAVTRASKSGSPAWPRMTCSAARLAVRLPSVRPNSLRRPGLRSMTSSVCRPIEPVAPRMATLMGRVISVDQMESRHVEVDEDRREENRIESIQDASMARDEVRRILHLGDSLHLRLDEVAHQRAEPDEDADDDGMERREREDPRDADQHDDHRRDHSRNRALDGLARAYRREEGVTADAAAHQQGGGVAGDDREDHEQRPYEPAGLGGVQEQVIVERHADVERSG